MSFFLGKKNRSKHEFLRIRCFSNPVLAIQAYSWMQLLVGSAVLAIYCKIILIMLIRYSGWLRTLYDFTLFNYARITRCIFFCKRFDPILIAVRLHFMIVEDAAKAFENFLL